MVSLYQYLAESMSNSHCSLGQLIKILRQPQMEVVVDKLIDFSGGKDEELRDISALGVYTLFIFFLHNLLAHSPQDNHC